VRRHKQALKSEKLRMTEVLLARALPLFYTKESHISWNYIMHVIEQFFLKKINVLNLLVVIGLYTFEFCCSLEFFFVIS
jgi:hypothetical protein